MNQCDICEKGVYFWQPYLSASDELVDIVWHRDCARDYDEWEHKITEKILRPIVDAYEPDMWKRIEEIQKQKFRLSDNQDTDRSLEDS